MPCSAMPLAADVDLAGLAAASHGFTGAELAGLCRWGGAAGVQLGRWGADTWIVWLGSSLDSKATLLGHKTTCWAAELCRSEPASGVE